MIRMSSGRIKKTKKSKTETPNKKAKRESKELEAKAKEALKKTSLKPTRFDFMIMRMHACRYLGPSYRSDRSH